MRSNGGITLDYTLFGESHSSEIGIEIRGFKKGVVIDFDYIDRMLTLRQGKKKYNTSRQEKVEYIVKSGIEHATTTGEKIVIVFENTSIKSKDYSHLKNQPRPGHADYVSMMKYKKTSTGGGHFSGRMTAPIVFFGCICMLAIKEEISNFEVISHINKFEDLKDTSYYDIRKNLVKEYKTLSKSNVLEFKSELHSKLKSNNGFFNANLADKFEKKANNLVEEKTSAGGEIETVVLNPPSFIGEPFFDSVEGVVSKLLYSIPSVKGVLFGVGEDFRFLKGHEVKDEIVYLDSASLYTMYNYNGGINGGITNGEDVVIKTIVKPIASIMQMQSTYDIEKKAVSSLEINGRHDTTIVNRIIPVIDSMICIAIYELLEHKKTTF